MNIESSVTSLDYSHGVCPQTQEALTCTMKGSLAYCYSPPSDSSPITEICCGQVSNVTNTGFTYDLVSFNNSVLTINLSFTATSDKNRTQVRCSDVIETQTQ